jgi:hypothetical protein
MAKPARERAVSTERALEAGAGVDDEEGEGEGAAGASLAVAAPAGALDAGAGAGLLVGWARSAGLRAPAAPVEGALAPNATGYLLAVGPSSHRLYPELALYARWSPALTLPTVAAIPFLLVPAPYGPLGVALLSALVCWLPWAGLGMVARARLGRHLARAPLVSASRPARAGQRIRLEGTVAEQPTVPALFTGRPVVLATSDYAGVVETRGIDFDVRLPDGELVHVPARDALLVGRARRVAGAPSCGPLALSLEGGQPRFASALLSAQGWLGRLLRFSARELTLSPGDAVELCGTLEHQPDPRGQHGFRRQPPLRPVMRPSGEVPVLVRKRA